MDNRTCDIHIRVTEQEKRRMEAQAKQAGIGLSAYLRRVGIGEDLTQPNPAELFDDLEEGVARGHHEDLGHQG
ncbi:plasmid mobilization protein [Candidatus Avoscillospira sp. LCP25S3_F1]|uniref:plasmid mobilization protein n=1 Tax=Candidatus Avoscillospira sp. LCP25S3_F1 TaxID=3438825 RepID=UPI003F8E83D5